MFIMVVTLETSKDDKFRKGTLLHPKNNPDILVTCEVLKLVISKEVNLLFSKNISFIDFKFGVLK